MTVDEWEYQREIYLKGGIDSPAELGFATFFLNRTNRSGIIKWGGVIGGKDQTGKYKIDCRFNKPELIRRVSRIAKYRSRIHISRRDALTFIGQCVAVLPKKTFLYVGPPYYHKGSILYTNSYTMGDHKFLADRVQASPNPWVVTYDDVPAVAALYPDRRQYEVQISYSVETKRLASEIMIVSEDLIVPPQTEVRRRAATCSLAT